MHKPQVIQHDKLDLYVVCPPSLDTVNRSVYNTMQFWLKTFLFHCELRCLFCAFVQIPKLVMLIVYNLDCFIYFMTDSFLVY